VEFSRGKGLSLANQPGRSCHCLAQSLGLGSFSVSFKKRECNDMNLSPAVTLLLLTN
jgi:hypothetical protein